MRRQIGKCIGKRILVCAAAAVLTACAVTGCGKKNDGTTAAETTAAAETKTETTAAAETTAPETTEAPAVKAEPGSPEAAKELAKDVWYAFYGGAVIPDEGDICESGSMNGVSKNIFLGLAAAESGAYTGSEEKESGVYKIGKQEAENLLTSTLGMDVEEAAALIAAQEAEEESIILYGGDWGNVVPFIEAESAENGTVKGKLGLVNGSARTVYGFTMKLAEAADSPFGFSFDRLAIESAAVENGIQAGEDMPEFFYSGTDPIARAACEKILADAVNIFEPGQIEIANPLILLVDDSNPEDVKVFGNFNVDGYTAEGKTLMSQSGAREPAVLHLKKTDNGYTETSYVRAADGSDFDESIREFCKGYEGLADRFFDNLEEEELNNRRKFVRMYILENSLDINSFQDYGWDPVELF